ncbi:MAG: hypothetical protein KGJ43_01975, partial [Acidobacteriota bacterium]|nr:hypothetical protein [Acidobacteriota bacterium]
YGAILGEYSGAYGYAFHDLGPTPVTVPLESPEQTLRLTIDPDQGPSTPGCNGESTPAPRPGASTPGATPPGSSHGAAPAGTVKVHIDTSNAMLDKRGRALLALSCSGDPCRGELTLSARTLSRGRGRRGPRHARRAARHRGGTPRRAADQLIGHVEVAIGEGRTQRVWVTIDKAGRSAIARARGHRLAVLARVLVGPRSIPTTAGQRHIELRSFRARRHQRRRRRRHGRAHRP